MFSEKKIRNVEWEAYERLNERIKAEAAKNTWWFYSNGGRNRKKEICTLWWGFISNFWVLDSQFSRSPLLSWFMILLRDKLYPCKQFSKRIKGRKNSHITKKKVAVAMRRREKNRADNMHTNFHACKFFHMEYSMLRIFFFFLRIPSFLIIIIIRNKNEISLISYSCRCRYVDWEWVQR